MRRCQCSRSTPPARLLEALVVEGMRAEGQLSEAGKDQEQMTLIQH